MEHKTETAVIEKEQLIDEVTTESLPRKRNFSVLYIIGAIFALIAVIAGISGMIFGLISASEHHKNKSAVFAPTADICSFDTVIGAPIAESEFVKNISANSEVTTEFLTHPNFDKIGEQEVKIKFTDTDGSFSEYTAYVRIHNINTQISAEKGISNDALAGLIFNDEYSKNELAFPVDFVASDMVNGENEILLVGKYSNVPIKINITASPEKPKEVRLDVENILQLPEFINGCEVVSLAIGLKYAGIPVSAGELYDRYMPKSPWWDDDPWTTYIGDARDEGLGCYAPCLVHTGNAYLTAINSDKKVYNISEKDFSYYESLIADGYPVIIWGAVDMNCDDTVYWENYINGKHVVWHDSSHCVVLIGYTGNTYIVCDPLVGIVEYAKADVKTSFNIMFRQACVIK